MTSFGITKNYVWPSKTEEENFIYIFHIVCCNLILSITQIPVKLGSGHTHSFDEAGAVFKYVDHLTLCVNLSWITLNDIDQHYSSERAAQRTIGCPINKDDHRPLQS